MAERRPLVLVDGEISELPQGDTTPGSGGGGGGTPIPTRTTFDLTAHGSNEIIIAGLEELREVVISLTDVNVVSGGWRPSIQVSNSGTTWLSVSGNYRWMRLNDSFDQWSSNDRIFTGILSTDDQMLTFTLKAPNDPAGDQAFRFMWTRQNGATPDVYVGEGTIPGSVGAIEQIRIFNQQGASNFNAGECIARLID